MPAEHTFWNSNLLSGLIGALIGAAASILTMFFTLKSQVESLRLERQITEESAFLNTLYKIVESGKSALLNPRRYCEEWQMNIATFGLNQFISSLSVSREHLFQIIDTFIKTIKDFAFLDKRLNPFIKPLQFEMKLNNTFEELLIEIGSKNSFDAHDKPKFNEGELRIIGGKFELLNRLLDDYEHWLDDNVNLIMKQKQELFGIIKGKK